MRSSSCLVQSTVANRTPSRSNSSSESQTGESRLQCPHQGASNFTNSGVEVSSSSAAMDLASRSTRLAQVSQGEHIATSSVHECMARAGAAWNSGLAEGRVPSERQRCAKRAIHRLGFREVGWRDVALLCVPPKTNAAIDASRRGRT